MKLNEIIKEVNSAVVDYIEGRDGVGRLEERMRKFVDPQVFHKLTKSGNGLLVVIIDRASSIIYLTSDYGYNPKDSWSVQTLLERYYQEIKAGIKPSQTSTKYEVGEIKD